MIDIIKAELTHLEELAQLFDDYRVWYRKPSDLNAAKKFLIERINNNESTIFCAKKENSLIGFVQLYPSFSSTKMKRMWILNDLFVIPSERGKGYSKKLINN